jgi:hypothetical protein
VEHNTTSKPARSRQKADFHSDVMLDLLFDPEYEGLKFARNATRLHGGGIRTDSSPLPSVQLYWLVTLRKEKILAFSFRDVCVSHRNRRSITSFHLHY